MHSSKNGFFFGDRGGGRAGDDVTQALVRQRELREQQQTKVKKAILIQSAYRRRLACRLSARLAQDKLASKLAHISEDETDPAPLLQTAVFAFIPYRRSHMVQRDLDRDNSLPRLPSQILMRQRIEHSIVRPTELSLHLLARQLRVSSKPQNVSSDVSMTGGYESIEALHQSAILFLKSRCRYLNAEEVGKLLGLTSYLQRRSKCNSAAPVLLQSSSALKIAYCALAHMAVDWLGPPLAQGEQMLELIYE